MADESEPSLSDQVTELIASAHWIPGVVRLAVSRNGEVMMSDLVMYKSMFDVVTKPLPRDFMHMSFTEVAAFDTGKAASVCVEISHPPTVRPYPGPLVLLLDGGFADVIHVRATDPEVEFMTRTERRFTLGGPRAQPNEWYPMVATMRERLYVKVPFGKSVKLYATMLPNSLRLRLGSHDFSFNTRDQEWDVRNGALSTRFTPMPRRTILGRD
jgi:hypothetical protein